jgi:hypothetical protein
MLLAVLYSLLVAVGRPCRCLRRPPSHSPHFSSRTAGPLVGPSRPPCSYPSPIPTEGEKYEKYKHLKHALPSDNSIKDCAAFAYMVCHAYVGTNPARTPSIADYTKTWCQGDEMAEVGASEWLASAPPGAFVRCKDVGAAAATRGLRISNAKLGRVIRSELGAVSKARHVPGKGKLRGYARGCASGTTAITILLRRSNAICD